MRVLGIESSCDETAASVVDGDLALLSNVVASSAKLFENYGGVIPEIAARNHIEVITEVIEKALDDSNSSWDDIDSIAVTYGAGLGGSLLVGVMTARTLSIVKHKSLYAINHVEGHVYANFLTTTQLSDTRLRETTPKFPLIALIASGGHSQLVYFRHHFDYILLGQTQDDAVGEAFDKVAKILGLPYPGGPSISQAALKGDAYAFKLPKAQLKGKYDFSFSGLKTAVLRLAQNLIGEDFTFASQKLPERLNMSQKANIAASFQRIAIEMLVDKTIMSVKQFQPKTVMIAGGVAASPELRHQLSERLPMPIEYIDPKLCTDNAAMIASLGSYKAKLNQKAVDPFKLLIAPNLSM